MKQRKEIIIIVVLTLLLLGSVGYIVYDKVFQNDSVNGEVTDDVTDDSSDAVVVTKEMDARMSDISMIEGFLKIKNVKNENVVGTATHRIEYLQYVIAKKELYKMTDAGIMQEMAYVTKSVYAEQYDIIFGDLYDLDDDLSTASSTSTPIDYCNKVDPDINNVDYVCWNPTLGVSGNNYTLTITSKNLEENMYKISGNYVLKEEESFLESGTFEISYFISNGRESLSSIILIEG